jgi:hypothetical protein
MEKLGSSKIDKYLIASKLFQKLVTLDEPQDGGTSLLQSW